MPSSHYVKAIKKDLSDRPYKEDNNRSYHGITALICDQLTQTTHNMPNLFDVHNIMDAINNGDKPKILFSKHSEDSYSIENLPIKVKYAYIGYINNLIWNS
jgi:hypothetical protein